MGGKPWRGLQSATRSWDGARLGKGGLGQRVGLYALSAICAVLLFVGGPDYYSPRSVRGAWSLGHVATFFLWTLVLIRSSAWLAARPLREQLPIVAVMALSLGFAIEWLQTFVDRTFSLGDILQDLTGTLLAIAFLSPARQALAWIGLRGLQIAALALILVQVYPVAVALADEIIARREFPMLSDLETPFERSRWYSLWPIAIDHRIARQGRASLRVQLMPAKYSGVGLANFPSDWRGYSALHFSVFNTSEAPLRITCRIHDRQHVANGEPYSDRYNGQFVLAPGWNDVDISLEKVSAAPATRTMNLGYVIDFSIFVTDLRTPRIIYLDDVQLK